MSDADMATMASWGLTVARLGFHWHLAEPAPGQWNETYMSGVRSLVQRFGEHGIRVIMDMHQDNWSPLFCGGHGLPAFYSTPYPADPAFWDGGAKAYPFPFGTPQYNNDSKCYGEHGHYCTITPAACAKLSASAIGWASSYMTEALGAASQRLYDDDGGIMQRFGDFWERAATLLRDLPGLLGYELLNEPWLGDAYSRPELLIPGVADEVNLAHLHQYLTNRIRAVDSETIIFFEPATGGNLLDATPIGYNASTVPGGLAHRNSTALSFHVYCPLLESDLPFKPGQNASKTAWEDYDLCLALNDAQLDIRADDSKRLELAGFCSEFGAVTQSEPGADVITHIADLLDAHNFAGWTYWYLTPFQNATHGGWNWQVPYVVRTYATSIAGGLLHQSFNATSGSFMLQYSLPPSSSSTCVKGVTRVFTSAEFHYPAQSLRWAAEPPGLVHCEKTDAYLVCTNEAAACGSGSFVTIKVWRAGSA